MTLQEIIDKAMATLEAAEAESPEPPIAAILDQALIQVALETARAAMANSNVRAGLKDFLGKYYDNL